MSPWAALDGLRIGCVRYLNSKPLIHGYTGPVVFEHPSALAADLSAGALDVALVPVFEVLRDPRYLLVDGACVGCDGPVYSVFLAHRAPLKELRRIALDPASRTSAHLLQVLLSEYHGLAPEYVSAESEADAKLLIGNQAIDFRQAHEGDHQYLDLGEEWRRCTDLPFVFAVWAIRPGIANSRDLADAFRNLKAHGLAHLEEIVDSDELYDRSFRDQYLRKYIRFDLGSREREGLELYRRLLTKHRLIENSEIPLSFV